MDPTFLVIVIVILPILSVCLGVTVHYVIQPMVDSLVDAVHDLASIARAGEGDRVARLESEVHSLRAEVQQLRAGGELGPGVGEQRATHASASADSTQSPDGQLPHAGRGRTQDVAPTAKLVGKLGI